MLHASEEYPNTYECGLQFFTAPEGKIINPKEIPCAQLAEEISELLNDDEMSDGMMHNLIIFLVFLIIWVNILCALLNFIIFVQKLHLR